MAKLQDGTYDFIGTAIAAFRAPGVTREDIERFRSIAEATNAKRIAPAQARQEVEQINASFGALWSWANSNAGALTVLIGIITLALMMYDLIGSDADAKTAHKDAQQILEVQERIYAALQKPAAPASASRQKCSPTTLRRQQGQVQSSTSQIPANRHERRKAAALARRKGPPS